MKSNAFTLGMRDAIPIAVVFFFTCISFGALTHAAGFNAIQNTVLMMGLYAMPLQLILINIAHHSVSLISIALFALVINFRFFLMSASLLPHFKGTRLLYIILSLPIISISSFTVSHVRFDQECHDLNKFHYFLGVGITAYCVAFVSSALGFYLGAIVHHPMLRDVLLIIMPIHFTSLTAMRWPKIRPVLATTLGFLAIPFFQKLSPHYSILIAPLLIGAAIAYWPIKKGAQ